MNPSTPARDWRLEGIERRLGEIEVLQPVRLAERVDGLVRTIEELRDEVKTLRRAVITFALTVAGAGVVFAFTAFRVFGSQ